MILVCGGIADSVTELVCARIEHCGFPYRLLDLGSYPSSFEINWHWNGAAPEGYIRTDGWKLGLDDITGVYVRYLGQEGRAAPPNISTDSIPAMYSEYDTGLMALFEDLPCLVVNRLAGGMSNNSKPYQAMIVKACGLKTPPTMVTNDPDAARGFYDEHRGEVIYKSLSGVRSIRQAARRFEPRTA
jgi:hypothetical protein